MITFSNQIRAFDFLNRDDLTCWHLLSMWLDTKYCAYQKDKKQYMSFENGENETRTQQTLKILKLAGIGI